MKAGSDRALRPEPRARSVSLFGTRISVLEVGKGPVVLLVHGVAGSRHNWDAVIPKLAERFRVVALDLPGHGESEKPRGDYSLGAYASVLRDLLSVLGYGRATLVGHSLGGGIAMQFAYQFPDRCERLILVASGGLGREVNLLLRAATLPGSDWVLPVIANRRVRDAVRGMGRNLSWLPVRPSPALREFGRAYSSLADAGARGAFVDSLRSVIDLQGQRVSAMNRIHLAAYKPTLILWGARDPFIPVSHAVEASRRIPTSRLEIFERSSHFPQAEEPQRFAKVLTDFIITTAPGPDFKKPDRATLRAVVEAATKARHPAPARAPGNRAHRTNS
ncbi:MAG: alpha/beta fold hydrolase [Isosphaeraceae bacterium]